MKALNRNPKDFKKVELRKLKYNSEFLEEINGRLAYRSKYNRTTKKFIISIPLAFRCHTKEIDGNTIVLVRI